MEDRKRVNQGVFSKSKQNQDRRIVVEIQKPSGTNRQNERKKRTE